jgi:porphobilinogen synthase
LRQNERIRNLIRETRLDRNDLILPLFAIFGQNKKNPISSMPGHFQMSVDHIIKEVRELWNEGIRQVILFGIPGQKDEVGSDACSNEGIIAQTLRAIKDTVPEMYVITDVCFCEYTDHGHCGILKNGQLDNDATLEILAEQVKVHARNGADMVAPSGMIDGMVGVIREALDEEGYQQIPIMSYAVKYFSSFYGPFREAAESAPQFGDRSSYQMDTGNASEAIREAALDVEEGADILMVKPAGPYLDIIRCIKDEFGFPTAAYQVSGEFAMIKAAAEKGWIDYRRVMLESLLSIKRAGADMIITYFTKEVIHELT